MRKFFFVFCFLFLFCVSAKAQVEFDVDRNYQTQMITGTGFPDYPPFGYPSPNKTYGFFDSIFNFVLQDYAKSANFLVNYNINGSYDQLVRNVRGGKFDFILGAYSSTDKYAGLELIYPALINNPIIVITPLYSSVKISKIDDLKTLKGGIGTYEHLSDFVSQQVDALSVQKIEKPYDLYKKLFMKEIDYVLASEYNARILLTQMGLRSQVALSSSIWSMPLFIGISKMSRYRDQLRRGLTRLSSEPQTREKLIKILQDYILSVEEKNSGVVAPDFIHDK